MNFEVYTLRRQGKCRLRSDPQAILALVKAGRTNAEIARQLGVCTRTLDRWRAADPDLSEAIKAARAGTFWHTPAPCGTTAAYQRHLRRHEPTDAACRLANTLAGRAQYAASKGAAGVDSTRGRPRCYPDVPASTPEPVTDLRVLIEQALARGWPTSRIMLELSVDYRTVKKIRARAAA